MYAGWQWAAPSLPLPGAGRSLRNKRSAGTITSRRRVGHDDVGGRIRAAVGDGDRVTHVAADGRDAGSSEGGGKVGVPGVTVLENVAATDSAALIVTVHAPFPLQAPLQPPNVDPLAATAVRVTIVPWL